MKQRLLIILAMGALIIGYRQLIMAEMVRGWFVTHDAIRVMAAPVNKVLIPHVVRGRGQLQAVEVIDVVSPVAGANWARSSSRSVTRSRKGKF